jgi:hypothetical protein
MTVPITLQPSNKNNSDKNSRAKGKIKGIKKHKNNSSYILDGGHDGSDGLVV